MGLESNSVIRHAHLSKKLDPFGTSIFTEMSALAARHGAINLSQGFPDFAAPDWVKEAACRAIREDHNQYAPSHGVRPLRDAIAAKYRAMHGMEWDADFEITVTTGATEAIHAVLTALLDPGDEVIAFEPFYDSYPACAAMNGARLTCVPLHAPSFEFDREELARAIRPSTKAILLNTPHNPTGKVFTRSDLETIGQLAIESGLWVITDEVYEHLPFGDAKHIPMASLPGMRDRTITINSTAKTFSLTGWKVGYVLASREATAAVRRVHQFVTFCTATPFQHAMALAIAQAPEHEYYDRLRSEYIERRDLLVSALRRAGFRVEAPQGTYFAMADYRPIGFDGDDVAFCRWLTSKVGVAAIPPSSFYVHPEEGRGLVRFCFCKKVETIRAAGEKLASLSEVLAR